MQVLNDFKTALDKNAGGEISFWCNTIYHFCRQCGIMGEEIRLRDHCEIFKWFGKDTVQEEE